MFHCCWVLIHSQFGNSLWKQHKAVWEAGVFAESSCSPAALVASQLLPPEQLTPSSVQRQDHKRKQNRRNLGLECWETSVLVKSGHCALSKALKITAMGQNIYLTGSALCSVFLHDKDMAFTGHLTLGFIMTVSF